MRKVNSTHQSFNFFIQLKPNYTLNSLMVCICDTPPHNLILIDKKINTFRQALPFISGIELKLNFIHTLEWLI